MCEASVHHYWINGESEIHRHHCAGVNQKDDPQAALEIVLRLWAAITRKPLIFSLLEEAEDVGEDVTDGRAEDNQNDDYDDSDEYEDQRVFYETLAFFLRTIQHGDKLLID